MKKNIGIDLGGSKYCVGVWRNNKVEIIPNNLGERITPSIITFNNSIKIGNESKKSIIKNDKNTINYIKQLIGKKFSDIIIQKNKNLWPFKLEKDNNDKILICIEYNKQEKKFHPEQILSFILENIKENAENFLGEKVKDVVITVPIYFTNPQKEAIEEACKIASLNVKIIEEPYAALLAYNFFEKRIEKRSICVFDIGRKLDISILEINNKKYSVKSINSDLLLFSDEFDTLLINYCIKKFEEETDIDISNNKKALRKFKLELENIKIHYSSFKEIIINLDSFINNEDFYFVLSREDFENSNKDLFDKCIECLKNTLLQSNLQKNEIKDLVLIGGFSRIPKIQEEIIRFFDSQINIWKSLNPDEVIAIGAAIKGHMFEESESLSLFNSN